MSDWTIKPKEERGTKRVEVKPGQFFRYFNDRCIFLCINKRSSQATSDITPYACVNSRGAVYDEGLAPSCNSRVMLVDIKPHSFFSIGGNDGI